MRHFFQIVGHFLTFTFHKVSVDAFKVWWTFNDQFITRSLPSPRVKKFWKSVNICRSYGQLSRGSFLWKTVYVPNISNGTMFGDLDWPLNASRGFVSIGWASRYFCGSALIRRTSHVSKDSFLTRRLNIWLVIITQQITIPLTAASINFRLRIIYSRNFQSFETAAIPNSRQCHVFYHITESDSHLEAGDLERVYCE